MIGEPFAYQIQDWGYSDPVVQRCVIKIFANTERNFPQEYANFLACATDLQCETVSKMDVTHRLNCAKKLWEKSKGFSDKKQRYRLYNNACKLYHIDPKPIDALKVILTLHPKRVALLKGV